MLVPKTASCLNMLEYFERNRQIVEFPLPGDLVFFKYSTNSRRTNHIGVVTNVDSQTSFTTVEGNTSLNSNDNGGAVMSRKRTNKNVVAFARPKYSDKNQLNRLFAIANGEIGITEYPPNSNNVKYNTWFYGRQVSGSAYPWCCTFVCYLFYLLDGGSEASDQGSKPTLRRGSKGPYVRILQTFLGIPNDGDFGPKTEEAVKNFQIKHGLIPDGIVGPKTWEKL